MSEFDQFAGRYSRQLDQLLGGVGSSTLEFARAKARLLHELAWRHVGPPRRLRILDLGCGPGNVTRFLEGYAEVVGADLAAELIDYARCQVPQARFVTLAPGPLPFGDGEFDMVFCACVMHHLKGPELLPFAHELRRVCRPGGLVTVFEHNPYNPVTRRIVAQCELDRDVERLFPLGEIRALFARVGLSTVESRYISFFPGPLRHLEVYEPRFKDLPLGGQWMLAATPLTPSLPPEPDTLDLSLVLPMYNEELNVEPVVAGLAEALRATGVRCELLVVDNGSRDGTREKILAVAERHPEVRLVTVYPNRGYGWGVLNGLRAARGRAVGWMAGDGQVTPADVVRTWERFARGDVDLAKVERITRGDGWQRRLVSRVWNLTYRMLFAQPASDVNGTPKIFWRRHLAWLNLGQKDWFIDAELMLKLRGRGGRVAQVPIDFHPRAAGRSHVRLRTLVEFYRNLGVYSLRYWWGRYTGRGLV